MRYCGIDVSAKAGQQQLCTLHPRRAAGGSSELVATFYEPGDVGAVTRTVLGFGREAVVAVDAPSGRRLDLLAAGMPLREALGLPDGRYERSRVCDALLFRRRLPLYPVPSTGQALAAWEGWMEVGFDLFAALERLGLYRPHADGALEGSVGEGALRLGRLCETYPDAVFCSLLGHRPSPKRSAPEPTGASSASESGRYRPMRSRASKSSKPTSIHPSQASSAWLAAGTGSSGRRRR